jgi:hypothetical protein
MVSALSKAYKVADALKSFTSETEFWKWYSKRYQMGSIRLYQELINGLNYPFTTREL